MLVPFHFLNLGTRLELFTFPLGRVVEGLQNTLFAAIVEWARHTETGAERDVLKCAKGSQN